MIDPQASRIIVQKAEADLDAGLEHLRKLLASETHGKLAFLARAVEGAVLGGIAMLELRPRMRDDVHFLIGLAGQVHDGADPAALADEHLLRVIRHRELGLVVRVKEPEFQPVVEMARAAMTKRLPDLARMVSVEAPKDYDDLLLRAFPTVDEPRQIVAENRELMDAIFAHAEAHPHLLRIPKTLVPRLANLAREVTDWQTKRVEEGLRQAYGRLDSVQPSHGPGDDV